MFVIIAVKEILHFFALTFKVENHVVMPDAKIYQQILFLLKYNKDYIKSVRNSPSVHYYHIFSFHLLYLEL